MMNFKSYSMEIFFSSPIMKNFELRKSIKKIEEKTSAGEF